MVLLVTCLLASLVVIPVFADDAGYALRFDGNSDFVEFATTTSVFAPGWETTKTVALWIKPDGFQADCSIVPDANAVAYCPSIFGDRPTYWGIAIGHLDGPNQNRIWVWNYDGSPGSIADIIGIDYTPGVWIHVALVHNNGMLRAFVNGVEAGSVASGPTLQAPGGSSILSIGGVILSSAQYHLFQGDLDEVSLWDRGLSASEIQANMYQDTPTSTNGLAAFYRMSNGSGIVLTDDSGNGNPGTLYDGARGVFGNGQPAQWVTSEAFNVTGPSVTINQSGTQADPTSSSPINFSVVFSEPVADFTGEDVSLSGSAGATTAVVTGGGTTYSVAVSGMTNGGSVTASINAGMAHNSSGEPNEPSASSDNTVTFQTSAAGPTVTIDQAFGQADPTSSTPINFSVVFSEAVTDFTSEDVSLSGTAEATTAVVTGSGTTYSVAVSDITRSGTVIATIPPGVAHNAGNQPNSPSTTGDNTVTYEDDTNPTVTINQAPGQIDPSPFSPVHFQVIFSEAVDDFGTWDVSLSGSTAPGSLSVALNGSGTTYDVAVTGMTGSGIVSASIDAGAAHDATGNASDASTSSDHSVFYIYSTQWLYLPLTFR